MTATHTESLHMVQLQLEARRLAGLGQRLGLFRGGGRHVSTNYLVHCALGELFQEHAPKPFAVQTGAQKRNGTNGSANGRAVRVLGYMSPTADQRKRYSDERGEDDWFKNALHERAKLSAPPAVYDGCDWDALATKEMPQTFPDGLRLRFELRACPVVRKSSAGEGENRAGKPRTWHAGQELDAFLAEAWTSERDDELDRETVYRRWLTRQFDQRGGATVEPDDISMERFSIERMTRRSHGDNGEADRPVHTVKKPDVTLTGTLTVTDGAAFTDLLRSGIGRHKSFGYGMLKVRRA